MRTAYEILEFNKILDLLEEHALSKKAKTRIVKLEPFLAEADVKRHLLETTEARMIIEHSGNPPLSAMEYLEESLALLGKGTVLTPEELGNIALFLTACRRLKVFLKKAEATETAVATYGDSLFDLPEVEDEINKAIRGGRLDDKASSGLYRIRRKIAAAGDQIKSKLDSLLRNNSSWFSESFVAIRNGHYTLPVKKEYKNRVSGTVIDISQSGGTYFIEPAAAGKLQQDLALLHIEEENEIRRILYVLTGLIEDHAASIRINVEAMESLDFIFAKAKLSIAMKASPLPVHTHRKTEIKSGRHPLLKTENVVPLDFHIGGDSHGVIITGPNTGGKTVALKTIGLFSLMAQSGLHVPAASGFLAMNNHVLCDIGDGQSISENLSTFSSHMSNIIEILRIADDQSLVLLDELGSGTDPAEGMGLAIAILEELSAKKCLLVATTHYPEIKEFARAQPGLVNARMAFDRQSLLPLYRLELGEAGESCALYIASRLGLPEHLVERARTAAYEGPARHRTNTLPDSGPLPANKPAEPANIPLPATGSGAEDLYRRIKPAETGNVPQPPRSSKFNIGDSVMVYPQKMIGIVYRKADEKGDVGVQLKKHKQFINHKRLKLYIPAEKLYPENYDFSIIFDSVTARKARHDMARKYSPGLILELENTDKV